MKYRTMSDQAQERNTKNTNNNNNPSDQQNPEEESSVSSSALNAKTSAATPNKATTDNATATLPTADTRKSRRGSGDPTSDTSVAKEATDSPTQKPDSQTTPAPLESVSGEPPVSKSDNSNTNNNITTAGTPEGSSTTTTGGCPSSKDREKNSGGVKDKDKGVITSSTSKGRENNSVGVKDKDKGVITPGSSKDSQDNCRGVKDKDKGVITTGTGGEKTAASTTPTKSAAKDKSFTESTSTGASPSTSKALPPEVEPSTTPTPTPAASLALSSGSSTGSSGVSSTASSASSTSNNNTGTASTPTTTSQAASNTTTGGQSTNMPVPTSVVGAGGTQAPSTGASTATPTAAVAPMSMPPQQPMTTIPTNYDITQQNGHMSPISETMVSNGVVLDQAGGAGGPNSTYIFQTGPVHGHHQVIHTTTGVPLGAATVAGTAAGVPAPHSGGSMRPGGHQPGRCTGGPPGGGGLHHQHTHRPHSPHRYSPNGAGGPQSRGNSPGGGGAGGQPAGGPGAGGAGPAAGPNQQHVVLVHVNPGETFSVRVGDQIQHIQGPATVRMVSNNGPPLPMPMQVPPGHMVQQIVDENGILTHVILSPQPPNMAAPPMTVGYYGGPNSAPQQIYTPYGPQYPYATHAQYPPHHHAHHAPPGPPTHMHHVGPPGPPPPHLHSTPPPQQPPHQCNNHAPHIHQGAAGPGGGGGGSGGGPPQHHNHVDDRTLRQRQRLREKLRQKEMHYNYHSHSGNSRQRPKSKVNGSIGRTDHSSSSSADGQELEDERRSIRTFLSDMKLPKVSNVDARSAFIQLTPPDCNTQEFVIHPNEFKYELLLSEKSGKYKPVYSGDAPEITLQDLKPATEYHLKVCSILDDLRGDQTEAVTFRTASCEPDPPISPKLSIRTKTSLLLKWNATADNGSKISGYSLECDQGRGEGNFVEMYGGLQRQHKVTKLSASTCYSFRLAAVNSCGKSQYSETVCYSTSGSVPSQPNPPALDDQFVNALTVSWERRPNDDQFTLQMEDEVTGHGFLTVYNGSELFHKIETLRRNTEYKFRLSANNEEGSSKWSDIVCYRTLPDRPSPPGKPKLKGNVHATSFKVIWDSPRDTGGAEVTKYHLELDDSRGFELVYEDCDREFTCDSLSPGHVYRVRVACSSKGGQSDWSECLTVQAQAVAPGACMSPKLQGKPKATNLHLRWNYPDYDGGAPVTEYEVLMTLSDNSTTSVYRGHALDCEVTGLSPGRSYLFQVRASNKAGVGPWSDSSEVVSGAGVPDPPKLTVSCKSPHWVIVSWDEPVNNGATVTDYRLEWQHRPDSDFTQVYYGNLSTYDVRGLSPASTYTFRVQALNSAGAGPFSTAQNCVMPPSSPGAVTHVRGTATADSIHLVWQEPQRNGSEIVAYNIDLGENHLISVANLLEHVIEDLQPETTYKLRVQAVNSIGVGTFSTPIKVTTRALPPNSPRLECLSITHNSLKLKWGDGKNPDLLQYRLEMRKENSSFQTVYQGPLHLYKINRLLELTEYHFRTYASNEAGEGPYSRTYSFKTTKAPPAAVRPPKVSEVLLDSCVVEWQACKPLGTDNIVYCLQLQNGHSRDQEYKQIYRGPETSYRLKGLSAKTEYQVRVCAIRVCTDDMSDLNGAYSPGVSFVTQAPKIVPAPTATPTAASRIPEPRQLTDQQWAAIILLGFAIFAAIFAFLAQKIIAYRNNNSLATTPGGASGTNQ